MLVRKLSRGSGAALSCHVRQLQNSAVLSAQPALQGDNAAAGGFFSKLFGGRSNRSLVPMTDPLPNVDTPFLTNPPSKAPETRESTLQNGFKIATQATLGPTATLGIYVDSGSVYEQAHQTGISHLLEYLAFKSTLHRTHFRLTREVEVIGGNLLAAASREQMAYNLDIIKTNVPEALEILADSVLNPKFNNWEVREQVEKLKADLENIKNNHQTVLLEGLHSVAFTGGLSRPLIAPAEVLDSISPEVLQDFHANNFTAPRMVLAASGVEHDELKSLAEPLLSSVSSSGSAKQPPSQYVGGDFRQFQPGPLSHSMVAFEVPGGWRNVDNAVTCTVLQFLLGGGGSFSTGGPGKGMHSRLYTRVLNQYHWVAHCTAFNSLYNDTGLFGIFASGESSQAGQMVDIICKELQAVTSEVPREELERAKKAAKSSVLMNLESRAVVAEDIGRQVLTYGHRKPVSEFLTKIDKITAKDVAQLATKMLKTPVSVASVGDVASVPRYAQMQERFG